jgi:DNA helicase-2/ATP-dependent DNA helicase PcrA
MSEKLNPQQKKAICYGNGPLLIIAGAGSGKTRVLTHRVAHLIKERLVPPERILALTFSVAAADEMKDRLESMIEENFSQLRIETFHALAASILRDNALDLGIDPEFPLYSQSDQFMLLYQHLEEIGFKHFKLSSKPEILIKMLVENINKAKQELVTLSDYQVFIENLIKENERKLQLGNDSSISLKEELAKQKEFVRVYQFYEELKSQAGALDFGDLLLLSLDLLENNHQILEFYQSQFDYILVDEFQDTDPAQSRLLDLLAAKHRNLTVVGDDDQGIYRFRGATVKNILDFQSTYPEATVVRLETNYRSREMILSVANSIARRQKKRLEKKLVANRKSKNSSDVAILEVPQLKDQVDFVIKEIIRLISEENISPSEIAILCKSVKNEASKFELALKEVNIPVQVIGGSGFFRSSEIRDLIAWLQLFLDNSQDQALLRILSSFPLKLNNLEVCRLERLSRRNSLSLFDMLSKETYLNNFSSLTQAKAKWFLEIYTQLMDSRFDLAADIALRKLIDSLGLYRRYTRSETVDNQQKIANLAKLESLATEYVSLNQQASLADFALYLATLEACGLSEANASVASFPQAVQVMTVHAAKGREFKVVFLVNLVNKRWPGSLSNRDVLEIPRQLIKEEIPEESDKDIVLAQARRLFYVAVTRAKDRLYLIYPKRNKAENRQNKISVFLEEIIEETNLPITSYQPQATEIDKLHLLTKTSLEKWLSKTIESQTLISNAASAEEKGRLLAESLKELFNSIKVEFALTSRDKLELDRKLSTFKQIVELLFSAKFRELVMDNEIDEKIDNLVSQLCQKEKALLDLSKLSYRKWLPITNGGLELSVYDIINYHNCPLKFKYQSIYRVPSPSTVEQRFGTFIHKLLYQYHYQLNKGKLEVDSLQTLFSTLSKNQGLGKFSIERQLLNKAKQALQTYVRRFKQELPKPVFFEKSFDLQLEGHRIRGRVDRVDKLSNGGYELIDYKTGTAWPKNKVNKDLQLSIYSLGAKECWKIEPEILTYYFVMDDKKIPVQKSEEQLAEAKQIIMDVVKGILSEKFEPNPNYILCRFCDYRIICSAQESGG